MVAHGLKVCILLFVLLDVRVAFQQADFLALHAEGPKKTKNHVHKKHASRSASSEVLATRVEQPTGRPEKNESAAEATGVAENAAGDIDAFIAALITNIVTIIIMWVLASYLRGRYPLVYSKNTLTLKDEEDIKKDLPDDYPKGMDADVVELLDQPWEAKIGNCYTVEGKKAKPDDSFFGWWSASAAVKIEDVAEYRGLDIAMLLEFSHVAMKISALVGLPLVLLVGPCHCFLGGYRAGAPGTADADYLSYWGMANVVDGHPWLYWLHAFILWAVIVSVQRMLYNAMRDFMGRRQKWLMAMPTPRATTVLVEGIPGAKEEEGDETYQTNERVKEYFEEIFGSKDWKKKDPKDQLVETAFVVKVFPELSTAIKDKNARHADVEKLQHKVKAAALAAKPEEKEGAEKELKTANELFDKAKKVVNDERKKVEEKLNDPEINTSKAFVTFNSRREAELAKMITYTPDASEWVVTIAPDPSDVLWADLQMDPTKAKVSSIIGYALIAGVFWAYLPTVVAIAYYTSLETLAEYSAAFKSMAEDPSTSALWDGMVNALALQLFMGFVPTFFAIIFSNFFCIKSGNSLQHRIQEWYFYFQVIFILLVTAIGSSLLDTLEELAESPTSIVYLLASTLPTASHFYLNYLPLQWVTHAQNMLRTSNLFKFKMWSKLMGTPFGVKKGEPEDQDYYGLGSRSARFTFMLVLSLNFCSLSPLIMILCFINFWVCRKCYGYLCVFCETKKPDLGGFFYVSQLVHVSEGLFIYIILMAGVLLERDASSWPGVIALCGLIFQYVSYNRFKTQFRWENLCFEDLKKFDDGMKGKKEEKNYQQPELKA